MKKGLIKVSQVPPNRYAYYLTPQGFAEKSRLTAEYLSRQLQLLPPRAQPVRGAVRRLRQLGRRRVALAGVSELAEIATLSRGSTISSWSPCSTATAAPRLPGVPVMARDAAGRRSTPSS